MPPPLTILIVHGRYQQPGGEDSVFDNESAMLEAAGHTVVRYERHNDEVKRISKLSLFFKTIWNRTTYREICALIRQHHPDVIHCHNIFPLISPSVYWAAARQNVPIVQTLHNYRMICINPYLYRKGKLCELCVGRSPIPGVIRRCYRDSLAASFTVAAMLIIHRMLGTYRNKVTTYMALTEFGRQKFLAAHLCDPAKVVVKPNAVAPTLPAIEPIEATEPVEAIEAIEATEPVEAHQNSRTHALPTPNFSSLPPSPLRPTPYALRPSEAPPTVLYAGRLSPEKGVDILIRAWRLLRAGEAKPVEPVATPQNSRTHALTHSDLPHPPHTPSSVSSVCSVAKTPALTHAELHIIGDGPERPALEALAAGDPSIVFVGAIPHDEIATHLRTATLLVQPSRCYEMFAVTPLEAMREGLPVIVSTSAATGSLVTDGVSGRIFPNGNADALASILAECLNGDTALLNKLGEGGHRAYLDGGCQPDQNLAQLLSLYRNLASPSPNTIPATQ